ncbi:MAG TPA: M20/M25/M40 family metallo-hydrolase [Micromonosporaceae bacterium]|nr:M20/M25/M40 family metallo-hydrolase [Micromonosporaceae bacterium]
MATLCRQLGSDPEPGLVTTRTQGRILDAISGLPVEVSTGAGLSSVVAVIRGAHPGGAALLRAGTDAIVTAGAGDLDWRGVDAAALVGAAMVLAERRDELSGDVVLAWQPGSHGYGGASRMLAEGLLNASGRPVDAGYALRALPGLPHGMVAVRSGPMFAAADQLRVTIRDTGTGTTRPVTVACQLATMLDRTQFGELTAVTVEGVATTGPYADTATVTATARTRHVTTQTRVRDAVRRLATGYAIAHGMGATVQLMARQPATVNHPTEVARLTQAVTEMYGRERLVELNNPVALSDDFGDVLDAVPGALALVLGAIPESDQDGGMALLPFAAALLASLAVRQLFAGRVTPVTMRRRVRHRAHLSVVPGPSHRPLWR